MRLLVPLSYAIHLSVDAFPVGYAIHSIGAFVRHALQKCPALFRVPLAVREYGRTFPKCCYGSIVRQLSVGYVPIRGNC